MSWNFRLAKKNVKYNHPLKGEQETTLYGVVEVYYDKKGDVEGWTDFRDPNGWDNVEDLRTTLTKMLEAIDKPIFEKEIVDEE